MSIEYTIIKRIINVKINYLNKIENIEDIKVRLVNFCTNLLIDNNLNIEFLNTLIIAENNVFYLLDNNIEKERDTRFFVNTIYELININESLIYYYSQNQGNQYKLFHEFSDIIYDLNEKILPKYFYNKLYKLQDQTNKLKLNIESELMNNPEHESFWEVHTLDNKTRKERIKNLNKKNEFIEVTDNFFRQFEPDLNEKISNDIKNYNRILIQRIKEDFNIDEDYNCYSLSSRSFRKLLHHVKLLDKPMIDYNISNKINNDDICNILYIFPEIVLDFSLMETKPFFKNYSRQKYQSNNKIYQEHEFIGKLKIRNPILRIHEKAKFGKEEEKILFNLLNKISVDKKLYNTEEKTLNL